ncbi:MAG: alpha/beta hydrolase family protein [Eubacteriales bacterium]
MHRIGQKWTLDALLKLGGWDLLHPESVTYWEGLGYNHGDIQRVFSMVKCSDMLPKAWSARAAEVEKKAKYFEQRGFMLAAYSMYSRAAQLYGRAQYSYFNDDPKKRAYHDKLQNCFKKVIDLNPTPIERVEIPFEGQTIYAILNLPANVNNENKVPCVILCPGMDMFKEDWTYPSQNIFVPRGIATLAIDGPGQGETLLNGCKCTIDNFERAGSAFIDYLIERKEIDPEKIVLFGTSMGSYWGSRIAATDHRLKAAATALGCYGPKNVIFNVAQPNFKRNFMYMAGIPDEKEFDIMAEKMVLGELMDKIECPFLMIHGEFDELTPVEDVMKEYANVKAPKELWLIEDSFHCLGQIVDEFFKSVYDWLNARINDLPMSNDRTVYIKTSGEFVEGTDKPAWWPS